MRRLHHLTVTVPDVSFRPSSRSHPQVTPPHSDGLLERTPSRSVDRAAGARPPPLVASSSGTARERLPAIGAPTVCRASSDSTETEVDVSPPAIALRSVEEPPLRTPSRSVDRAAGECPTVLPAPTRFLPVRGPCVDEEPAACGVAPCGELVPTSSSHSPHASRDDGLLSVPSSATGEAPWIPAGAADADVAPSAPPPPSDASAWKEMPPERSDGDCARGSTLTCLPPRRLEQ